MGSSAHRAHMLTQQHDTPISSYLLLLPISSYSYLTCSGPRWQQPLSDIPLYIWHWYISTFSGVVSLLMYHDHKIFWVAASKGLTQSQTNKSRFSFCFHFIHKFTANDHISFCHFLRSKESCCFLRSLEVPAGSGPITNSTSLLHPAHRSCSCLQWVHQGRHCQVLTCLNLCISLVTLTCLPVVLTSLLATISSQS